MKDYRIIVDYQSQEQKTPTSAQAVPVAQKKVQAISTSGEKPQTKGFRFPAVRTAVVGTAMKINQYVGELTENTVTQRRRQVGLTFAAAALLAFKNPILGISSMAVYAGNAAIQYQIRQFKENQTAGYMRNLSGGVAKTGR